MTEECALRRDVLKLIRHTIDELVEMASPEALVLVDELYEDVADIELGSRWNSSDPADAVLAGWRLLRRRVAA